MSDILQRDHRTVRGTIRYTSKKPERLDEERGREYFTINVHGDGKRTCIAHCEIDDRPSVMRDITYSLDEDWYPMDCFVRLAVNDRFMGSGWFRFGPDFAECETYTSLDGRVTQRMATQGRLKTFQNHAIVCDAWHMRLFDLNKAGETTAWLRPLRSLARIFYVRRFGESLVVGARKSPPGETK